MDAVQKFISENQHQLGYIMDEASRQWIKKDKVGALTVGDCNFVIEKYGKYHEVLDKMQRYEKALQQILEEEATQCEGYETAVFKLAREVLGIKAEEYWNEPYYYKIGAPILFNWKDTWHKGRIIRGYRTHDGVINVQLDSGLKVWCGEARHAEFIKQA